MTGHRADLADIQADAAQILEAVEKGLADQPAYARLCIDVLGSERALQATLWLLLDGLKTMALVDGEPLEQVVMRLRARLEGPPW
jgi:hypothetical protein